MVSVRLYTVLVVTILLALPLFATAKGSDLTGNLEAFLVVLDAEGDEALIPAESARPRDVIEYRLTYRNTGDDSVCNIFIMDPIPSGTVYVPASASLPTAGQIEFSIDQGKTFHPWPIVVVEINSDGREIRTEATPDMVTHIRWVIAETFSPETAVTVSYRTTVK